MTLQEELEEFLSSAKVAMIPPHGDVAILLWFGKDQLEKFSDPYMYEMLIGFFAGRRITLLVYRTHPSYAFSFVDIDSGDCINVSKVHFVPQGPDKVFASIAEDTCIEFDIIGTSADNQYMVEPPEGISTEPMILRGYKIV